ncbi:hypothetical protein ABZ128_10025 [Streptomyces sp. NPDC006326]|uniref:hypothetical protein n=1 Tax=Streptomyces sp. NPDC006326 TaxID=3156752 RepID=UPI0033AC997A
MVSGDVEQAAAYGLADSAKPFAGRGLVVDLVHRDLDKDVVDADPRRRRGRPQPLELTAGAL